MKNCEVDINKTPIQPYYLEFMRLFPNLPFPGSVGWKHNCDYIAWIMHRHDEFRKIHGIGKSIPYNEKQQEGFIDYLKSIQPIKNQLNLF